jgi:hypothetical protein
MTRPSLSRSLLSTVAVASIALSALTGCMDVGSLDDGSLLAAVTCPANVPAWAPGVAYKTDDVVSFVDPADPTKTLRFFRVRQPHKSQSDWTPPLVASLFEEVTCSGVKPPAAPPTSTPTPPPPAPTPPPPANALAATYAPYFFAFGWNNAAFPFRGLVDMKAKSGLNGATLAFVLARNGACAATTDVFDNQADVNKFVSGGGLVKASFGGAFGTYLENACATPEALAAVIIDFVRRTGIGDLDFDVEQDAAENATINARRARALRLVQDANIISAITGQRVVVKVSFTVPSVPTDPNGFPGGMTAKTVDVLKAAVAAGVKVTYVNLMTMDFGPFFEAGRSMGTLATLALTDASKQLQSIFSVSSEKAFAMLGVTPMIGVNDTTSEVFTIADVKTLTDFVKLHKVGLVSYWGINRDQPGGDIALAMGSSPKLAGVPTFAFTRAFTAGLK